MHPLKAFIRQMLTFTWIQRGKKNWIWSWKFRWKSHGICSNLLSQNLLILTFSVYFATQTLLVYQQRTTALFLKVGGQERMLNAQRSLFLCRPTLGCAVPLTHKPFSGKIIARFLEPLTFLSGEPGPWNWCSDKSNVNNLVQERRLQRELVWVYGEENADGRKRGDTTRTWEKEGNCWKQTWSSSHPRPAF